MTDPIRIPVTDPWRDGKPMRAEITPDLARQIVTLAYKESNAGDKLREIENKADAALHWLKLLKDDRDGEPFLGTAHQSELERAHAQTVTYTSAHGCLSIVGPDGQSYPAGSPEAIKVVDDMVAQMHRDKPRPVAAKCICGPMLDSDNVSTPGCPVHSYKPQPVADDAPCGGSRCYKTELGWTHSTKSYESCCVNRGEPEPADKPVADDAAVEALSAAWKEYDEAGYHTSDGVTVDHDKRRWHYACDVHTPGVLRVVAALKAQLAEALEECASRDLHASLNRRAHIALGGTDDGEGSSWHDIPERIAALRASDGQHVRDLEACYKVQEGLRAELAATKGQLAEAEQHTAINAAAHDQALADLTACRAELESVKARAYCWEGECQKWKERAEKALAELAAERERVAVLKGLLREIATHYHDNRAGGCPGAYDRLDEAVARIDAALGKDKP